MIRRTVLLLFCALALWGQAPQGLEARVDAAIRDALRQSGVPSVSVAVVQDGRLAYAKAFGSSSLEPRRAATVRTRYAVGSISKQFTAAALLLLQEEGKLSLDDKVAKYFPDLTRAGEISIRQLLSHVSGYEDYAPQDYLIPAWTKATTAQQILDGWAKKPLNFDPGARWQYSNTNYVLAAAIFEKVSGRKLLAFLRDRIFGPLDMQSAGAWNPTGEEEARAYTRYALGPPRPVAREAAGWYFGAGDLAMTPSDLARWDIAFLQKKILSAKSYEEFTREAKLNGGGATRYALGLSLRQVDGVNVFQHGGEVSGFLASNTVAPPRDGAVVILSNQDCVSLTEPLAQSIFKLAFGGGGTDKQAEQARSILEALAEGRIDRSLFTENANSYFSEAALRDCRASLRRLGRLISLTAGGESQRGGMMHRSYRAQFQNKTLNVSAYLTTDGKYDQFLVVEQM